MPSFMDPADLKQIHGFLKLQSQIRECDALLESMESLLHGHQEHLGNINAEISVLQQQSKTLTVKLENRHATQSALFDLLEGIVISPELVKKIFEGEVNEFFLQHLAELNKKMTYVKSNQDKRIRAFRDIGPELERLRLKV